MSDLDDAIDNLMYEAWQSLTRPLPEKLGQGLFIVGMLATDAIVGNLRRIF